MNHQRVLQLVALLPIISQVYSSCDLIGLPKCECKYPSNKRYELECQNVGLSALPSKVNYTLPDGYAIGNFSNNEIEKVPDFYFLYMKHFDVLDFTSNKISEFAKNSFTGLQTRLVTLILKRNRISTMPKDGLREYIRLNTLDLSWNDINSPCQIHTADVVTYSLAHNGISTIDDLCFAASDKVQTLDLSQNSISRLGIEAFAGMSSLKKLDLGYNEITDLGDGLKSLVAITTFESLSLRGNSLEHLRSFCPSVFPYIKSIDFGFNDLIDIQQYCFSSYAGSPSNAPNLFLNFEHNVISSLPEAAFAGLNDRLTELKLNHNRISAVNVNAFGELQKLGKLDLDNNRLDNLEFLRNWKDNSLHELSVANNLIQNLSPNVFQKMMKLTKLSLDGNLLLNIDSLAFQGMGVLDDLSLRYNLLTNLAGGAFEGLGLLKKLRLSGNALVTLKNCTFASLDHLSLFHFDDNLLHCDCDLLWILKFKAPITQKGVPDTSVIEPVLVDHCHYPNMYDGEFMVNVVSLNCPISPTNACFGLQVTTDERVDNAMNISWSWDMNRADGQLQLVTVSQIDVETGTLLFNMSGTFLSSPVELPVVEDDKIYKICVDVSLKNGAKALDCTIWPTMIKKPTTTMAPTTEMMTPETGLDSGSIAAICLGVILIIIIVLIVLFAIYLWRTQKYRHIMPRKYIPATQTDSSDHDNSFDRSPSSMGKSDPLDFHRTSSDPMLHGGRSTYQDDNV